MRRSLHTKCSSKMQRELFTSQHWLEKISIFKALKNVWALFSRSGVKEHIQEYTNQTQKNTSDEFSKHKSFEFFLWRTFNHCLLLLFLLANRFDFFFVMFRWIYRSENKKPNSDYIVTILLLKLHIPSAKRSKSSILRFSAKFCLSKAQTFDSLWERRGSSMSATSKSGCMVWMWLCNTMAFRYPFWQTGHSNSFCRWYLLMCCFSEASWEKIPRHSSHFIWLAIQPVDSVDSVWLILDPLENIRTMGFVAMANSFINFSTLIDLMISNVWCVWIWNQLHHRRSHKLFPRILHTLSLLNYEQKDFSISFTAWQNGHKALIVSRAFDLAHTRPLRSEPIVPKHPWLVWVDMKSDFK